jgi:hypothetical protein
MAVGIAEMLDANFVTGLAKLLNGFHLVVTVTDYCVLSRVSVVLGQRCHSLEYGVDRWIFSHL